MRSAAAAGRPVTSRSLRYTNAIAGVLNLLPPSVVGGMLKHVDFLASNVPGFTFPVYLAGARLVGVLPVRADDRRRGERHAALLRRHVLHRAHHRHRRDTGRRRPRGCIRPGFEEVLGLGGEHAPVVLPLHA